MNKTKNSYLESYYSKWHNKSKENIERDINLCIEKSFAACKIFDQIDIGNIDSILEVGCGFGKNLVEIMDYTKASFGLGCDISKESIEFANKNYANDKVRFLRSSSLDIQTTVSEIREVYNNTFDLLILFDVLEHVPKPKEIIREISKIAKYFFIILPLDDTIFENYFLPERAKVYPSFYHSDGHLWEFNVNDVHKFISSLGLAPIVYDYQIWSTNAQFPSFLRPKSIKGKILYNFWKWCNYLCKKLLPKKIFLRLMGRGYFVCLATWHSDNVLE